MKEARYYLTYEERKQVMHDAEEFLDAYDYLTENKSYYYYEASDGFCKYEDWKDWMEPLVEAEDGEELSEEDIININNLLKNVFDEVWEQKEKDWYSCADEFIKEEIDDFVKLNPNIVNGDFEEAKEKFVDSEFEPKNWADQFAIYDRFGNVDYSLFYNKLRSHFDNYAKNKYFY